MIPLHDDNPTRTFPYLTIALIVSNVGVFLTEVVKDAGALQAFFMDYAIVPAELLARPTYFELRTLITSMFLHGGWMHLVGNMLYLWIFGNNIEDSTGRIKFILFYVLSGLGASAAQILSAPHSQIPNIGASGAISGVLGGYLLLFPHARVMALVPLGRFSRVMYVPAWVFLIIWFGMQLFSGWSTVGSTGGGVAWWAHIGGFVSGMVLIGLFKRRDVEFFHRA